MKKKYIPNLINKLTERSYNYINNIIKIYNNKHKSDINKHIYNISIKPLNNHIYHDKSYTLFITIKYKVIYDTPNYKHTDIFHFLYTINKSSQIEYICIKDTIKLNSFLSKLPVDFNIL